MDSGLREEILSILKAASEMTVATVRSDGYPQATTVNYVSDGLVIYFGCAAEPEKVRNIARSDKVSLTVTPPHFNWDDIRGLSIGVSAIVGRENVVAGTDCSLGGRVHADLAWAKLQTLVEGARLASTSLWP